MFGITEAEVLAVPQITETLDKHFGIDGKPVERIKIFNFLAASDSKDVRKFLEHCRSYTGKPFYEFLSMEELCVSAKISPLKILSTVAMVAKKMKSAESAFQSLTPEDDEEELDRADEAWDQAFPRISEKLDGWSERRRNLSEVSLSTPSK
jgi:hypothetical protein